MKYERPEMSIYEHGIEDVIVCSPQENFGTGGGSGSGGNIGMDQFG